MQLFILLLIALVVGYLIARSRWSKNIDEAASKAADSTISLTQKASDWVSGNKADKPEGEVVDAESEDVKESE